MDIVCSTGNTAIYTVFSGITKKPTTQVKVISPCASIDVGGKWDTGASMSCISLDTAKRLCLTSIGRAPVGTANGGRTANLYLVDLDIGGGIVFSKLLVCDGDIDAQGIGILIGMDVISNGDFSLKNGSGQTLLHFKLNNP